MTSLNVVVSARHGMMPVKWVVEGMGPPAGMPRWFSGQYQTSTITGCYLSNILPTIERQTHVMAISNDLGHSVLRSD